MLEVEVPLIIAVAAVQPVAHEGSAEMSQCDADLMHSPSVQLDQKVKPVKPSRNRRCCENLGPCRTSATPHDVSLPPAGA